MANRSAPQRLGAVAVVLILLSAPFGGWRSASEQDVVPLEIDQQIDIGPFYVTIERVRQVSDLPPVIEADGTSRFLVITARVTNHTDRPEFADLVTNALSGKNTGALAFEGDDDVQLHVYGVDDAVEVPASELINPDLTYTYAFVLRQRADVDLDDVTLAVYGYHFQEVDPQTLDPEPLGARRPSARGGPRPDRGVAVRGPPRPRPRCRSSRPSRWATSSPADSETPRRRAVRHLGLRGSTTRT